MQSDNKVYVIGEVGQNHNGSMDIARQIIDMMAADVPEPLFNISIPKMDAVKFTRRDLREELSKSQMDRPYDSAHSFGKTYGEHRAFLELNDEQHFELYKYAKALGFDFVETLCAIGCLSMLKLFEPDKLKVASRDLTNLPLLNALAETRIPIILSTGMAGKKELDDALDVITKVHSNVSILHCVSQYPTHPQNVNLNSIIYLKNHYPNYTIGYSDHTIGIATPIAAMAMGARIIEKHVTLDRNMKGTDQAGSLGPDGVKRMMRDIRLLEKSFGKEDIFIDPTVESSRTKLERSIASKHIIKKGEVIKLDDIHMLSPGDGFKWSQKDMLIGKKAWKDIQQDEVIYTSDIEPA